MSPSGRRRATSPDPHLKRHRSRSHPRLRRRSRPLSRSPRSSHPARRPQVFPSHHDHPHLPAQLRLLCQILSSPSVPSHSLPSLLDHTGLRVSQSDVEAVLRLSYSHPRPALTFFRWAGERHLTHLHSPYSWNLVVDMLGKNLHFDAMWDTVRSMRDLNLLSLATFASIFASLAADARAGEAFAAFRALPMYGIPRDTVALNSLLAAMCRAGLLEDGRAVLHEAMQVGVRPDADSFAVLLEGCENEKDPKCAEKVFDEMVTIIGWNPINRPAFDSFLVTLLSSHDDGFLEAMRYLEDLRRHNCSPGPKFFRAALQVCHGKSDNRSVIALWEDCIEHGMCPPDTAMYNYIIFLSCKEKRPEAAMHYFDAMVLYGAFPDPDTCNVLFQMLVKARKVREAVAVLNEMLKNECPLTHTNCLLAFDTKDRELCIKVWQCMLKHGIHPLEEAGNSLVSLLDELDLLPEACKYAEDLIDNGVKLSSCNLAKLKRSLKKVHKDKIHEHLY